MKKSHVIVLALGLVIVAGIGIFLSGGRARTQAQVRASLEVQKREQKIEIVTGYGLQADGTETEETWVLANGIPYPLKLIEGMTREEALAQREFPITRQQDGSFMASRVAGVTSERKALPEGTMMAENRAVTINRDGGAQRSSSTPVQKKIAVIIFNFQDNQTQGVSRADVESVMTTGTDNVEDFFEENSYNRWDLSTDIYGWYTAPISQTCSIPSITASAHQAAAGDGFHESNYDQVVYMFPEANCQTFAFAINAKAFISLPNGFSFGVVSHEMGHAFGLGHAFRGIGCTSLSGNQAQVGAGCAVPLLGQGEQNSFMGSYKVTHMPAVFKRNLGILEPSETVTVTQSGTYRISPNALPGGSTYLLEIPTDRNAQGAIVGAYYLDYRQPYSYDRVTAGGPYTQGVTIRTISSRDSLVWDMTPGSLNHDDDNDAPLATGKTLYDQYRDISITTLQVTPAYAEVQITFGPHAATCTLNTPRISVLPSMQNAIPGQTVPVSISLKNNNSAGCAPAVYRRYAPSAPVGWGILPVVPSYEDISTLSGTTTTIALNVTVPLGVFISPTTNYSDYSITAQLYDRITTPTTPVISMNTGVVRVQPIPVPPRSAGTGGSTASTSTAANIPCGIRNLATGAYIPSLVINAPVANQIFRKDDIIRVRWSPCHAPTAVNANIRLNLVGGRSISFLKTVPNNGITTIPTVGMQPGEYVLMVELLDQSNTPVARALHKIKIQ